MSKVETYFMIKSTTRNLKGFIQEFPQLIDNFKGLINSHYSFDIFESEEARKADLTPI